MNKIPDLLKKYQEAVTSEWKVILPTSYAHTWIDDKQYLLYIPTKEYIPLTYSKSLGWYIVKYDTVYSVPDELQKLEKCLLGINTLKDLANLVADKTAYIINKHLSNLVMPYLDNIKATLKKVSNGRLHLTGIKNTDDGLLFLLADPIPFRVKPDVVVYIDTEGQWLWGSIGIQGADCEISEPNSLETLFTEIISVLVSDEHAWFWSLREQHQAHPTNPYLWVGKNYTIKASPIYGSVCFVTHNGKTERKPFDSTLEDYLNSLE